MTELKGIDIRRLYISIRKVVPEHIDLDDNKTYTVEVVGNTISIFQNFDMKMIYFCHFKTPEQ